MPDVGVRSCLWLFHGRVCYIIWDYLICWVIRRSRIAGVERAAKATRSWHTKPGVVGVGTVEVREWIGRVGALVMWWAAVKVSEIVIVWIIIKAAADGWDSPNLIKLNILRFFRDVILSMVFRHSFCLHLMSLSSHPSDLNGLLEQRGVSLKQA